MKTVLTALIVLSACFALGWRLGLPEDGAAGLASAEPQNVSPALSAFALHHTQAITDPLDRRLALLSLVENADAAELERLFTAARLSDDPAARRAVALRWAEVDPAGFYRHLAQIPADDRVELNDVSHLLFQAWGRAHPEAALAAAWASIRQEGFQGIHWSALSAVLENNPEKGFALALKDGTLRHIRRIQKSVWEKDPARFVKAFKTLDASGRRLPDLFQEARREALMAWSETDFPGALAWVRTLNPSTEAALLPRLLSKLASRDLLQARTLFESLAPSPAREAAGSAIVGELTKRDPRAALEWIETSLAGGRAEAYGKWINAVAANGFDHAAGVLETLPEGSGRDQALRALAGSWAEKDLTGAVNWIKKLPDAARRREAVDSIKWKWANEHQAGYQEFVATAPLEDLPDGYQYGFNLHGSPEEQTEQLRRAAELPEDRREKVFNNNLHQASWNHPPALVAEMLAGITDPAVRQNAAEQAVKNMLDQDPGKAARFLEALPADTLTSEKRETLRQTVNGSARLTASEKENLLGSLR